MDEIFHSSISYKLFVYDTLTNMSNMNNLDSICNYYKVDCMHNVTVTRHVQSYPYTIDF